MKKVFTLLFAAFTATNMMAQMHGAMSFAGKSNVAVLEVNSASESDTIKFTMTSGTAGAITFPSMKYEKMEIPSFTVDNVAFSMDMSTHLVTFSEQEFSATVSDGKTASGKLSGTYSMADNKMSITAVFKYGSMPLNLTYTIDGYYVKAVTATPLYVSVGGTFNYQNESVTYNVRKYKDGDVEKLDVEIPTYTLDGTVMGNLTLGTYTVKGLTYNEAKGGYYHDYANDGLTFHFTAVNKGTTTMDNDYAFNAEKQNDILVTYDGNTVSDIKNTFQMGTMPFPIVSSFKSPTTGISSVTTSETINADGKMYNLSGQQVNEGYKGVVIMNGKKYFNK